MSELAFRAQLVIREQRELFDYWRACAKDDRLPARSSISPAAIPLLLPGISILDVSENSDELTYRVAGTRLREIYGHEVTGRSVFALQFGDKLDYWRAVYRKVTDEGVPMQGAVKGPVADRDHIVLFWMRLPLSDDNQHINKILCYDVALPVSVAYELGSGKFVTDKVG